MIRGFFFRTNVFTCQWHFNHIITALSIVSAAAIEVLRMDGPMSEIKINFTILRISLINMDIYIEIHKKYTDILIIIKNYFTNRAYFVDKTTTNEYNHAIQKIIVYRVK